MKKTNTLLKKVMGIELLPLMVAYAIMIAFFAIKSPYFLSFNNFMGIALYASITGIVSLSNTFVISSGRTDFSVGSAIALGSCVMGAMMRAGQSVWAAMAVCLLITALTGVYNGIMIAYVGMNHFIVTLAGMQILRGIAYLLTEGNSITIVNDTMKLLGRGRTWGIPNAVIILLVLLVVFTFIAKYTSFGRRIFVIGGNVKAAELCGFNVKRDMLLLFIVHGLMVGVAAIIYTAQLGAALPTAAVNTNFSAISACVLGGVSLKGGKGSMIGSLLGVLVLETLANGLNMLGVVSFWQDVITGLVLLVAVGFDLLKKNQKVKN